MSARPEVLARKTVYESPWVRLHVDRVRFPAGRIAEQHHFIDFPNEGAAALVTGAGDDRVLLIESYRYIHDTVDWELPAGSFDPAKESPEEAASREVLEETGYESEGMERLCTYYPIIGISNCKFHILRCRALEKTAEFDANEVRQTRWFTRREVQNLLAEGRIRDGFALTGLLLYLNPLKPAKENDSK